MLDNTPEQNVTSKQNVNDLALDYLADKYGEEFKYYAPDGSSYTGTRTFLATCESLGDFKVLVQIENYKNEDRVISDNYLSGKYKEETYSYFKSIVDEVFSDNKVYYEPFSKALSADLSADSTFEEYLADVNGAFSVVIVTNQSNCSDKAQLTEVIDKFSSSVPASLLSILLVVVTDAEYEDINEDKARSIAVYEKYVCCAKLTRSNGFSDSVILEGNNP